MRTPIFTTLPLLIALVALGWHNQRWIEALRTIQQNLTAQAAIQGVSLGLENSNSSNRPTRRPRPDREAGAKSVAASLIAYAAEPHLPEDRNSESTRLRVLAESERVMLLDGSQLKILIAELQAAIDMDAEMRKRFIRFALKQLTETHPQDALAILQEDPDLDLTGSTAWPPDSLFADALRGLAEIDSQTAAVWFDEHRNRIPDELVKHVETSLVRGAIANNPQLALQRFSESGNKPRNLPSIIGDSLHTPDARLAFLQAFRQWNAALPDGGLDKYSLTSTLTALSYGDKSDPAFTYDNISRWLEQADFSPEELNRLTLSSFDQHVRPAEVGQWIEWLEASWPEKYAQRCQRSLLSGYQTSVAAAEWLINQPDSPQRREMAGLCAMSAFGRNRETAIRLALSLPAGDERQSLLGGLYFLWPKDDSASRAAAEAFAKEHGIEK